MGKTSLVGAIAKAAGRELVRINLSEQTVSSFAPGPTVAPTPPTGGLPRGQGKTSLVGAIAKAVGRELVRINLSEQTVSTFVKVLYKVLKMVYHMTSLLFSG